MNQPVQKLVHFSNNRLVTTSLDIAQNFGKKHKDILRSIQHLECSREFNERNFAPVGYTDSKGERRPMYEITRDGFVFLCMGFTGTAAAQWKEKYIAAFNALEAEVSRRSDLPEADRETLQYAFERAQRLQEAYLHEHPDLGNLARYYAAGLTQAEMAKLLDVSRTTVRERLKLLDEFGVLSYRPDAELSAWGKKGNAARLERRAAALEQQTLDLEA